MIFACSIGSAGSQTESYSIYFPIEFSPGRQFSIDGKEFLGELDGLNVQIEQHHHLYSLRISSFESEEEARVYLDKLLASLRWVTLKHNVGIKFPAEIKDIHYYKETIVVSEKSNLFEMVQNVGWSTLDGDYNADSLTIIPEHKKLSRWENGRPAIILGLSPSIFIEGLNEGISFPRIENIINNKKLCTAIELYSSYSFEVTNIGRFVKLVTVIESLLPELTISEENQSILDKAKKLMKNERKDLKDNGECTESIDRLINRVRELTKESIGRNIEVYVEELIVEFPDLGKSEDIIPRLKTSYNVRSRLLHDGEANEEVLSENIAFLNDLVPKILKNLFIKNSNLVDN